MVSLSDVERRGPFRSIRRRNRTGLCRGLEPADLVPRGISSRSRTAPLRSIRRISLSSPSQVPCHSSPSTQVTPVTKRLDSMVRRMAPVSGSIWWILRSRCSRRPRVSLGPGQARVAAVGGRRDGSDDLTRAWVDLLDSIVGAAVLAVEGGAGVGSDGELAIRAPLSDRARRCFRRGDGAAAVEGHSVDLVYAGIGPYSRRISACWGSLLSVVVMIKTTR